MKKYRFSTEVNSAFAKTLKKRVNEYFSSSDIKKSGNAEMVLKTICALGTFLLPFLAMLIFQFGSIPLLFLMWVIMGAGAAFIGTSVMHDAIHGSYTRKKNWKRLLTACTWLLGIDPTIWKTQHNVLHHSFTNIEGADDDIEYRHVLRFSPHQKIKWFHRYQHFYAVFFF